MRTVWEFDELVRVSPRNVSRSEARAAIRLFISSAPNRVRYYQRSSGQAATVNWSAK